jgi:excisionase family DNA binding protein
MKANNDGLVADGLVSVDEAMAFLSVSRSTLYELMDKGMLAYAKIGRSRRVPRRALVELAAANLRGGGGLIPIRSADDPYSSGR